MAAKKIIKITNGNYEGSPQDQETKPRGNGVDTQNYLVIEGVILQEIELFIQNKYNCFKHRLENESERKYEDDAPFEDESSMGNIPFFGFPIGPGRIGNYAASKKKKGYAGKSNIYMGMPDKEAEDLADKIEKIIADEEKEHLKIINETCENN